MNILFLSTASAESIVALYSDDQLLQIRRFVAEKRLGEDLLPAIIEVLHEAGLVLQNLETIVVYPGPGSFTGTRIGVVTANVLAWSLNIPVIAAKHADFDSSVSVTAQSFVLSVAPLYAAPASVTLKYK